MARRSVLFSPGDQPALLRKAPDSGADVVVFDLEDAVAPGQKAAARETVAAVLAEVDPDRELCVRVNPLANGGRDDLDAVVDSETVDSVMLPKTSGPKAAWRLRQELDDNGADWPIIALLETAAGILNARDIATVAGVDALAFGAEDLSADTGATRTDEGHEISYARQRVVLAANAADIDAIDTLVTDFEDTDHLEADAARSVEYGYDGKMAIHPSQVSVINEAFTPDEEAIAWAESVIEARDATDRGVFKVDGEMIDAPLIAQAEQILERARAAGRLP